MPDAAKDRGLENLEDKWGGKCISLNQPAGYLVWNPIHSIHPFLETHLMKAHVQSMREREQSPFCFIPRPGLFNDVIWACLGTSLCRTCPFHSPNHLPLWFFFSLETFQQVEASQKAWVGRREAFWNAPLTGGVPTAAVTLQKLPYWRELPIQSGVGARVDSPHHDFDFFSLSLHNDWMTLWDKGARLMVTISALTRKGTEFARIKDKLYSVNGQLMQMDACQTQRVPWWGRRM